MVNIAKGILVNFKKRKKTAMNFFIVVFLSVANYCYYRGVQTKTNATSTTQWYDPTTLERSRGASLSSLNELDIHSNAIDKQV